MRTTVRHLRATVVRWLKRLFQAVSTGLTPSGFKKELKRRNARRVGTARPWLMPEEALVAEALAKIVVPSDEESPGIDEVCVLGQSAIDVLNEIIKRCPDRQALYPRGLLAFDVWALKEHGCNFTELTLDKQTRLFRAAQGLNDRFWDGRSKIGRIWRRLETLLEMRRGTYYAAMLYPLVREDSLRIFYTSRVSWIWLGYDGPPMENGYASLTEPRDAAKQPGLRVEKASCR
jgi:hypothetical protein